MWKYGCVVVVLMLGTSGCALYEKPEGAVPKGGAATAAATTVPAHCRSGQRVRMKAKPLSPYVYRGGDGYAYFDVLVEACPVPGRARRQPLDIALVVDTSGSMGGQKIAQARAAAHYLLSVLTASDRLSLVTYNTRVFIQFPLTAVTPANRSWMARRVARIYPSGMTNLGGGLSVGTQQLTRAPERNSVSRVILISDGLANVGVTHPTSLSSMAASARQRRASVTTMGVGQQFNELLLQSLAEYGGGRYHYISRAQDLVSIFRREIQGVQRIAATGINLQVEACPGCRVVSVPGYAVHRQGANVRIAVSDLAGGETMKALVKVKLPTGATGATGAATGAATDTRQIRLKLSYAAVGAKRRTQHSAARVAFRMTSNAAQVRRTTDVRVAGRVARVQANRLTHKAMTAYQFGNTVVAGNLLRKAAGRLRTYTRRYKVKKKTYAFEADSLSRAARKVRRPAARPSQRRHMIKRLRNKASKAYRR